MGTRRTRRRAERGVRADNRWTSVVRVFCFSFLLKSVLRGARWRLYEHHGCEGGKPRLRVVGRSFQTVMQVRGGLSLSFVSLNFRCCSPDVLSKAMPAPCLSVNRSQHLSFWSTSIVPIFVGRHAERRRVPTGLVDLNKSSSRKIMKRPTASLRGYGM